ERREDLIGAESGSDCERHGLLSCASCVRVLHSLLSLGERGKSLGRSRSTRAPDFLDLPVALPGDVLAVPPVLLLELLQALGVGGPAARGLEEDLPLREPGLVDLAQVEDLLALLVREGALLDSGLAVLLLQPLEDQLVRRLGLVVGQGSLVAEST